MDITQQQSGGEMKRRQLTEEEKRKLIAARRMQRLKQRGNAFLNDPENALKKTETDDQPAQDDNIISDAANDKPKQKEIVDEEDKQQQHELATINNNNNNNDNEDDERLFSTPTKSSNQSIASTTPSTPSASSNTAQIHHYLGDTPRTPKTPETPIVDSSPQLLGQPTLQLNEGSPQSPEADFLSKSPFTKVLRNKLQKQQQYLLNPLLKDTKNLIPDEEEEEDNIDIDNINAIQRDDRIAKFMGYLRLVLILIFATYSALYSCLVPCDPISGSYLNFNQTTTTTTKDNLSTCADRANSIMTYDWSSFSVGHISTWPYIPPLILFLTIQLVVMIPRLMRYFTVKKNKNSTSMLDMFLFALQIYSRVRKLLTEICLFIFTYVMVIIAVKFVAQQTNSFYW